MKSTRSVQHGFKQIGINNWQEPDLPSTFFGYLPDSWVEAHLKPQLDSKVPAELAALFEVARGAMIYSWYFYPLATLGTEQCSRVLEAGVRIRCQTLDISVTKRDKEGKPKRNKWGEEIYTTYYDNLAELKKHGAIPPNRDIVWDAARAFRNLVSHPDKQMILPPGMTWQMLQTTSDRLNELFSKLTV
jgi:hypothetical protein